MPWCWPPRVCAASAASTRRPSCSTRSRCSPPRARASAVAALDDADARACTTAERVLLADLEAGCTAPVGALAEVVEGAHGPELSLRAVVAAPDGSVDLRRSLTGDVADPAALGHRLARLLLEDGAAALVVQSDGSPLPDPIASERAL